MQPSFGGFDRSGNQFDLQLTALMQQIDALRAKLINLLLQLKALQPPMPPAPDAPAAVVDAYAAQLANYEAKVQSIIAAFNHAQADFAKTVTKLAALVAMTAQQMEKKQTAQKRAEMARMEVDGMAKTVATSNAYVTATQQQSVIEGAAVAFVGLTFTSGSGDAQLKQAYIGGSTTTQADGLPTGSGLPTGL
jgi:hypothetical protein